MLLIFLILVFIGFSECKSCKKGDVIPTTTVRMRLLTDCEATLTRGTPGPAKGIRYFFDSALDMCFPYLYEGADEGVNSWIEKNECETWCIPQDFHSCGGENEGEGSCGELTMSTCSAGLTCVVGGLGIGFCCNAKDQEEWGNEFTPTCPNGAEPISKEEWFGKRAILGKNCEHKFCPEGSECHPQRWMSFCCPKTSEASKPSKSSKAAVDCGKLRKQKKSKKTYQINNNNNNNNNEYKH